MKPQAAFLDLCRNYPKVKPSLIEDALVFVTKEQVRMVTEEPPIFTVDDPDYAEDPVRVVLADDHWLCPCDPEPFDGALPCIHVLAVKLAELIWDTTKIAPNADEEPEPDYPLAFPEEDTPIQEQRRHEPHSLSIKAHTRTGFEVYFCLRGFDANRIFREAAAFVKRFEEHGWTAPYGGRHPSLPQPLPGQQAPVSQATNTPIPAAQDPPPPLPPPSGSSQALIFHASHMDATFLRGKWYWSVFGPDMPRNRMKHGIRIWEEGLATGGFRVEKLDPQQPPSLQGFLAEYILDAEGKPEKVIRLYRQPL